MRATGSRPVRKRLVILLLVSWGLLVFRLGSPFYGVQDSGLAWIASSVRNYDLYGLDQTGLMMVRNVEPTTPENFYYYSHHPPMMVWAPALATIPFGFHELGVRYASAAMTLITIATLYALACKLYGQRMAFWSAAFFAFTPFVLYFGRTIGHDRAGMLAGLAFALVLVDWLRQPTRKRYGILVALIWAGVWSAWAAVIMIGALGVVAFLAGPPALRRSVVGLGVWGFVACVTLMGFYQLQWSGSIDSILDAFVWRTSSASGFADSEPFTMPEWVVRMITTTFFFGSAGIFALGLIGVGALRRHSVALSGWIVFALFAGGLGYQLAFRNASYIHDYYQAYFAPAMAISAAAAWVYTRHHPKARRLAHPISSGLALVSVAAFVIVWGTLHFSGHRPTLAAIIDTIDESVDENDMLAVNFRNDRDWGMPIMYYNFRPMRFHVSAADAIDMAESTDAGTRYIYCTLDEADTPRPELEIDAVPQALLSFPAEPIHDTNCLLFDLTPDLS